MQLALKGYGSFRQEFWIQCRFWEMGQILAYRNRWTEELKDRQQRQLPNAMLKIAKTYMNGATGTNRDTLSTYCKAIHHVLYASKIEVYLLRLRLSFPL